MQLKNIQSTFIPPPAISQTCGYSLLKNIFTRDFRYKDYPQIVENAKNKILGNIPDEFIHAAKQTQNIKQTVEKIKTGFANATHKLNKVHILQAKAAKTHKPDTADIKRTYERILDGERDDYLYLKKRISKSLLSTEKKQEIEESAAKIIKDAMSEILPQNTSVSFKHLGEGNFATTYKLSFRDAQNKKVFKDYAVKVYKDSQDHIEANLEIDNKIKETLYSLTDDEIKELYRQFPVYKNGTEEVWAGIFKNFRETNKPLNKIELEKAKAEEIITRKYAFNSNGVTAEANTYYYIENAVGHPLLRTNLNKHYMFDIENKFNISNFSDKSLPERTGFVKYENIGVIPFDAYENYENIVYGRVIDVGNTAKGNKDLTDKTIRKYFKKIVNRNTEKERNEVLENLKKLASNPKTPLRNKIEKAVQLAEDIKSGNKC